MPDAEPQSGDDDDEDGEEEGSDDDGDSDASSMGGIQLGGPKPGEQPEGGEDEEEEKDPYDLPPSDDEEEMAELRRRVLASKPFANPKPANEDDRQGPQRIERPLGAPAVAEESDAESGSDVGAADDDDFDNIMNAAPVTDRAGITAAQRKRAMEQEGKLSVTFSRNMVSAPSKWQS